MRGLAAAIAGLVLLALFGFALASRARAEFKPVTPFGAVESAPPSAFGPRPVAAPFQARGPLGSLFAWVLDKQQSLQRTLAMSVKALKTEHPIAGALTLAALSFLYGILHAVGPGHGKTIISSYVVANEETVRRGIVISFIASAVQALMAVALVSVLLFGLSASGLAINYWSNQLETVSYALIALVGLYLLAGHASRLWRLWRGAPEAGHAHDDRGHHAHDHVHRQAHSHHHANHGHHGHDHASGEHCDHIVDARRLAGAVSWRKMMAVVFSVGVRPCTGAILVLVFAVTQGLFWAGVAATFAMALGTAITVAALAIFALGSRELALKLGGGGTWARAVWTTCAIGGAIVIFLFGALLFAASLGPARPF